MHRYRATLTSRGRVREEQAAQDPREREPEMIAYREAQERRAGRSG